MNVCYLPKTNLTIGNNETIAKTNIYKTNTAQLHEINNSHLIITKNSYQLEQSVIILVLSRHKEFSMSTRIRVISHFFYKRTHYSQINCYKCHKIKYEILHNVNITILSNFFLLHHNTNKLTKHLLTVLFYCHVNFIHK